MAPADHDGEDTLLDDGSGCLGDVLVSSVQIARYDLDISHVPDGRPIPVMGLGDAVASECGAESGGALSGSRSPMVQLDSCVVGSCDESDLAPVRG